jgi:predicted DNA-binding helix-hairpin-helix protein
MGAMKASILDARDASRRYRSAPRYAPAGQSTQMIVGADAATDSDIVQSAAGLYHRYAMRRVYYSAFSPIPDASAVLPLQRPPLMREHRLYQSDWLMRFYGFAPQEEIGAATKPMACCRSISIPSLPGR